MNHRLPPGGSLLVPCHRYSTAANFMTDVKQIAVNARTYHGDKGGAHRYAEFIGLSNSLVEFCQHMVSCAWSEIQQAEAAIQVRVEGEEGLVRDSGG